MQNNFNLTIKVQEKEEGHVKVSIRCDGNVESKYLRGITRTVLEGLNEGSGQEMFTQHYIVAGINDFMGKIIEDNMLSED